MKKGTEEWKKRGNEGEACRLQQLYTAGCLRVVTSPVAAITHTFLQVLMCPYVTRWQVDSVAANPFRGPVNTCVSAVIEREQFTDVYVNGVNWLTSSKSIMIT